MTRIHERSVFSEKGQEDLRSFDEGRHLISCEYCVDSGRLVTRACRLDPRGDRTETGYFVRGTEPKEYCTCHVPVLYDVLEGGVCLSNQCPDENVKYVGLISVNRSFPVSIYVTDAQYVWREIGGDVLPETVPSLPFFANALQKGDYCGISRAEQQYNRLCRSHFDYFAWKEKQKANSS